MLERACSRCAEPFESHESATLCAHCQKAEPQFDRLRSAWRYEGTVKYLLHRCKFDGDLAAGTALGEAWAEWLATEIPANARPDLIVATPLHPKRWRRRGFNQSLELARPISKALSLPIDTRLLQRQRYTAKQSRLSAVERRKNLRGAFKVTRNLSGERIAVIDDVATTGSTANEIARTLRCAGAGHIEVWTAARAARFKH